MDCDLATRVELVKLARALGTTPDGVAFAASLDPVDIGLLRERVVGALYDEHRAAPQRVAAITRLLPTLVNVRIALRAFPPLLAARVAGEMARTGPPSWPTGCRLSTWPRGACTWTRAGRRR